MSCYEVLFLPAGFSSPQSPQCLFSVRTTGFIRACSRPDWHVKFLLIHFVHVWMTLFSSLSSHISGFLATHSRMLMVKPPSLPAFTVIASYTRVDGCTGWICHALLCDQFRLLTVIQNKEIPQMHFKKQLKRTATSLFWVEGTDTSVKM